MSMDTRNLYDRWTKDVHAGGAYHATIYIPGYVWPTVPCFFTLGSRKMATSACLKRHPPAGKQVIFCRPARRNLWCRFGGGRGFQRDNIDPQVCTAPLPKPGPKAQSQIVLTSDPFKTAVRVLNQYRGDLV